ncbi:hypothetical protein MIDIC_310007 [Alphaproteobacteria bacterium]
MVVTLYYDISTDCTAQTDCTSDTLLRGKIKTLTVFKFQHQDTNTYTHLKEA